MEVLFALICIGSFAAWILLKHSIFSVPFVIFLSLWVQDFYPLSHFPMYSDPDESENYFYLAKDLGDGKTEPLPVRAITGVTAPKVKKLYKAWAREFAEKNDKSHKELTDEERAEIGRELIQFLFEQAGKRNQSEKMKGPLALVEVWIVYDTGTRKITETPAVVATATL